MTARDDMTPEALRGRLRKAGLRPTRQREELAGLLFAAGDRHVTAETLHREALAAGIRVSLATVYNALHRFTEAGLLREIVVDSERAYYDTNTRHHHHFFNTATHELVDIPGAAIAIPRLPEQPVGTAVDKVDVVVRIVPAMD